MQGLLGLIEFLTMSQMAASAKWGPVLGSSARASSIALCLVSRVPWDPDGLSMQH